MEKVTHNLMVMAIVPLLMRVVFSFNIVNAAAPFGPQKPETGFGGKAEAVAADKWADGSMLELAKVAGYYYL